MTLKKYDWFSYPLLKYWNPSLKKTIKFQSMRDYQKILFLKTFFIGPSVISTICTLQTEKITSWSDKWKLTCLHLYYVVCPSQYPLISLSLCQQDVPKGCDSPCCLTCLLHLQIPEQFSLIFNRKMSPRAAAFLATWFAYSTSRYLNKISLISNRKMSPRAAAFPATWLAYSTTRYLDKISLISDHASAKKNRGFWKYPKKVVCGIFLYPSW